MDIEVIAHQMIRLFLMMGCGYLLFKVKLIDEDFNKKLTKLLLNFTLPAMILSSVLDQPEERDYSAVAYMFLFAVVMYAVLAIMAVVLTKAIRVPGPQQGIYMFMFMYGNVGFMGFPIMDAIYGSLGVFYAAIVNIIFNLSSFSLGVAFINYQPGERGQEKHKLDWKKFLTPGVSVSLLSVVIYLAGISLPEDIVSICDSVGNITSPLAMILIGATLATMKVKEVFTDWRLYIFAVIRLALLPAGIWLVLRLFVKDPVMLGTLSVMILMPVANSTVLFANMYGRDEKLGARGVFITTLLSIGTVPLMLYFLT